MNKNYDKFIYFLSKCVEMQEKLFFPKYRSGNVIIVDIAQFILITILKSIICFHSGKK
jgi:hypothetical protein